MLTDYTSYDQIRATLSVTDTELEDANLALPFIFSKLLDSLEELSEDMQTTYEGLYAQAPEDLTANEEKFIRRMGVYSTYHVAVQLLDSLPLLAVQTEQDARASYERFEKPFERVDAAVRATFAVAKKKLVEAFNLIADTPISGGTVARVFTNAVTPTYDPVTG